MSGTAIGRVVYDAHSGMGYKYSARIVEVAPTRWKKRRRWVYVIDRHFINWSPFYTSRKYDDPGAALKAANLWLNIASTRPGVPVG